MSDIPTIKFGFEMAIKHAESIKEIREAREELIRIAINRKSLAFEDKVEAYNLIYQCSAIKDENLNIIDAIADEIKQQVRDYYLHESIDQLNSAGKCRDNINNLIDKGLQYMKPESTRAITGDISQIFEQIRREEEARYGEEAGDLG